MKKFYIFFMAAMPVLIIASLILRPTVVHASFNANNIMDDVVFDSAGSMDETSIQNFLNRWPGGCLTNYQAPYPLAYSTFDGNTSAANVIYRAAQYWGVNPQVILATLQKESSVVTGDASYGCQYINTAMGYDCPDAGNCPVHASNLGFSQQVMHAAWQLRFNQERSNGNTGWDGDSSIYYYGYMTQGSRARVQGGSTVYYDGTATIDGTSIYIGNGATASLYSYTPHFHGNQNFVNLFESWFGPVYSGLAAQYYFAQAHPTGALVRGISGGPIYKMIDGYRLPIPTYSVFRSLNYRDAQVKVLNQGDAGAPVSPEILGYRNGTLVRENGDVKIYVVECTNQFYSSCVKQHIANYQTFAGLGYQERDVLNVPSRELANLPLGSSISQVGVHPNGTLLIDPSVNKVYIIQGGKRYHVLTAHLFDLNRFDWQKIKYINGYDVTLPVESGFPAFDSSLLARPISDVKIYAIGDNGYGTTYKRHISTYSTFVLLGYTDSDIINIEKSLTDNWVTVAPY